ncbi:GAF and ANTAR domain-containing protein [Arthrobacter sp. 92]|uniref:GAF and ANTAR domain-containing protein n=1 Tax=Arthrobacter sp. 92 TaxID=3418175 RepID=UPI003D02B310
MRHQQLFCRMLDVRSAVTEEQGGLMYIDASKMDGAPETSGRGGNVTGELATRLGDLARELQHEDDLETVLSGIVEAAVQLIPGAAEASISLVTGRKEIESKVASGDLPRRVDALQSSTGQGPCLDAAYEDRNVRVPDLSTETRWPAFCSGAVELGARSMLAIQLFVEGDRLGALSLFGARPDAFDLESEQIGLLVAAHAAVAFADSQKISQLNEALITRQLIGQAEGILMERYKITAQQAFLVLTRASSSSNTKLRDVAEHLCSSGEVPAAGALREPT